MPEKHPDVNDPKILEFLEDEGRDLVVIYPEQILVKPEEAYNYEVFGEKFAETLKGNINFLLQWLKSPIILDTDRYYDERCKREITARDKYGENVAQFLKRQKIQTDYFTVAVGYLEELLKRAASCTPQIIDEQDRLNLIEEIRTIREEYGQISGFIGILHSTEGRVEKVFEIYSHFEEKEIAEALNNADSWFLTRPPFRDKTVALMKHLESVIYEVLEKFERKR